MKPQRVRFVTGLGALGLALMFAACGGLDEGQIVIVASHGGSTSAGGSSGSGGKGGSIVGAGGDAAQAGSGGVVTSDDPPVVVAVSPTDTSIDNEPATSVELTFSETLDDSTVTADNIVISDGNVPISGQLTFGGVTATFTPDSRFDLLATYTVTAKQGLLDLAGQPLQAEFTSTFAVRDGVWGHEQQISNALGSVDAQTQPDPAMDGRGNALAVWGQALDDMSNILHIWGRFYTPGVGWGDSFQIDDLDGGCSGPSVAMNAAGDAVVAWRQEDSTFERVMTRRYIAGAWEDMAKRVDGDDVANYANVTTGVSAGGDFHVLWTHFATYHSVFGNHASGSADWAAVGNTYIAGSYTSLSPVRVAFDGADNGFAIWVSQSAMVNTVRVVRYLKASNDWDAVDGIPNSEGAEIGYALPPRIAADPMGGAMALWTNAADIVASRFTKAAGWAAAAPVDTGAGTADSWSAAVDHGGGEFGAFWFQDVSGTMNVYASQYTDAWQEPALVSDGDTGVFFWSDLGFGLDRHGNGLGVWIQQIAVGTQDVLFGRFVHSSATWTADKLNMVDGEYMESVLGVSRNGMGVSVWATGYPYGERHDALFGAVFE